MGLPRSPGPAGRSTRIVLQIAESPGQWGRAPLPRFLGACHGASVAPVAMPQNDRSPRRATLRSPQASPRERPRSREAMIAWRQRAGRPRAGQGRKPAEPGARSASLDGLAAARQRLAPSDHGAGALFDRSGQSARCVETQIKTLMLRAFQIEAAVSAPRAIADIITCEVREPTCRQLLGLRGRPQTPVCFNLAITRSAVCASPSLRDPLPNYDPTKTQIQYLVSRFRASSLQSTCRIFGDRPRGICHPIGLRKTQGLRTAVPIICRTDAGSGRPVGRGNVRCCG
jgi:hypothetical protein